MALIGTMQTLVENFPMNILQSINVKKYGSAMEFLMDIFGSIGITDKEIIQFLLTDVIAPDVDLTKLEQLGDEKPQGKFVTGMEKMTKELINIMLSEILSCTIHPKVPDRYIENGGVNGLDVPVSAMDPSNLLSICPTSRVGKYMYNGVSSIDKPSDLNSSTDLNCVMWYSLYKGNVDWDNTDTGEHICKLRSFNSYNKIRVSVDTRFEDKPMYQFNKAYLNSITLFSQKVLLMGLYDKLINGFPNISINYTINQVFSDAVIGNIIKNVVKNDDTEINDCYYTFSNEDWDKMLETHDLQMYNGKKLNSETAGAIEIDKDMVLNALDSASSATTLYDKKTIVENTFFDVVATPTQDASLSISDGIGIAYNNNWLIDLLTSLIEPVVKSVLTPKVMTLIIINYDAAGLIDVQTLLDGNMNVILEFIKQKLLGFIIRLVKLLKDIIINAVLNFLIQKITPLIAKWKSMRIMEQIEDYLVVLHQALECITIFQFGTNVLTVIDDVNYADIVPEKITPETSIC